MVALFNLAVKARVRATNPLHALLVRRRRDYLVPVSFEEQLGQPISVGSDVQINTQHNMLLLAARVLNRTRRAGLGAQNF